LGGSESGQGAAGEARCKERQCKKGGGEERNEESAGQNDGEKNGPGTADRHGSRRSVDDHE